MSVSTWSAVASDTLALAQASEVASRLVQLSDRVVNSTSFCKAVFGSFGLSL